MLWFLHLHLSLLVCFMLSFPRLPFELDIPVTLILPRAAFFFLYWPQYENIWEAFTKLSWFPPIKIKSEEQNHLFTSPSKRTKSNYFCFGRSLTFSSPSAPLKRGPQEERLALAEKSSTSAHKQTLMISWLKLILRKKLWGKAWFGNSESAQKSVDHSEVWSSWEAAKIVSYSNAGEQILCISAWIEPRWVLLRRS